jgi:hypothetical protein
VCHTLFFRQKQSFDRSFAIRFAASDKTSYQFSYDSIVKSLAIEIHQVSIKKLAIQTGCDMLVEPATYILKSFYHHYTATLNPEQKQYISISDASLVCASFWVTANTFRVIIVFSTCHVSLFSFNFNT